MDERTQEIETLRAAGKLVFCTKCGSPNSKDDAFCGECGERLVTSTDTAQQANQNTQQTYTGSNSGNTAYQSRSVSGGLDPAVLRMVGENLEYYEPKFKLMKATNSKTSWNWPAFLATPFWLIYRRMYLYGGVFLGASIILAALNLSVLVFAADIACGILGNYIYMTFLEKTLADANHLQEPLRQQTILSHTGTSTKAVWICIGIYVGVIILSLVAIGGSISLLYDLL